MSSPSLEGSALQVSSSSSGIIPPPRAKAVRSSHETPGLARLEATPVRVNGREKSANDAVDVEDGKAISIASSVSKGSGSRAERNLAEKRRKVAQAKLQLAEAELEEAEKEAADNRSSKCSIRSKRSTLVAENVPVSPGGLPGHQSATASESGFA